MKTVSGTYLTVVLGLAVALPSYAVQAAPQRAKAAPRPITPEQDKANLDKLLVWVQAINSNTKAAMDASLTIEEISAADVNDVLLLKAKIARIKARIPEVRAIIKTSIVDLEKMRGFDLSYVGPTHSKSLNTSLEDNITQVRNFDDMVDKSETMILAIEQGEKNLAEEFAEIRSELGVEVVSFQAKSARSIFTTTPRNSSNSAMIETIVIAYEAMDNALRGTHAASFEKPFIADAKLYRDKALLITKAVARGRLEYKGDLYRMRSILNGSDNAMAGRFRNVLSIQLEWFDYASTIPMILNDIANEIDAGPMTSEKWGGALNRLIAVETKYGEISDKKIAALRGS